MSAAQIVILLPLIVPAATAVVILLVLAVRRHHGLTFALTLGGLGLAMALLPAAAARAPARIAPLLVLDKYALFYMGLIYGAAFVVVLFSHRRIARRSGRAEEYYLLLMLAVTGAAVLTAAAHFASFFLGLEALSVALYALIAYERGNALDVEAGVKYLVLAGVSSAFLLFGMALLYAELGTMEFHLMPSPAEGGALAAAGMALVFVGLGFKLALVPFHMWTPDVYQGAPAPVAAFIATVSKGAVFALLLRYLGAVGAADAPAFRAAVSAVAVASMLAGNLLALRQWSLRRILAYSSIAHFGYLLVAFLAGGRSAVAAATCYLVAYIIATLGAWGALIALAAPEAPAETLADLRGLARRRPWLAALLTLMVFSLAGMPLTAGFIGKFYLLSTGVSSNLWALVLVIAASSLIGLFYYLRIVAAVFQPPLEPASRGDAAAEVRTPAVVTAALAALALLLTALGVFPAPFVGFIQAMVAGRP